MFVFLKIVLFFFRPLLWIILLFIAGAFIRNKRKKQLLYKAGFAALLFFSNPFIIRQIIQSYEVQPVQLLPAEHYTAGIVLGGFVSYNSKDKRGYFNQASDRFIQTLLLYKTGHIHTIIVAAGNGYITEHNFKEASFIKQRLTEAGIPPADIFTDTESRNTEENAANSRKIIDAAHLNGPFLLISSALHLPRAQIAFAHKGVPTKAYPCDFASRNTGNNYISDYLLPAAAALSDWDDLIKELLGVLVYKLKR